MEHAGEQTLNALEPLLAQLRRISGILGKLRGTFYQRSSGFLEFLDAERGRTMPTLFTRIINGELPGRFVWKDDLCVAFLSINPLRPGHTLVVSRAEVDHWLDLEPDLAAHLMRVSQAVGKALQHAFNPMKVGLMIAGLEVPHVHLHVVPISGLGDLNFANQDLHAKPEDLDGAAATVRASLRALGYSEAAD
jgi:histidine triad (HIT) family protein